MSLLPYHALTGAAADPAALEAERKAAVHYGRVFIGAKHLFLGRILGLGGGYIAYPDIERWYIRQCEANVEPSTFYSYMFVVEYTAPNGKPDERAVNFEEKKKIDALRAAFAAAHPEIPFGRLPGRPSKYNW